MTSKILSMMNVARRRRQSCLTQNNSLIWIWIRFLPKWQNSKSFYKIAILEAVEYLWSLEKQQIPPSSWSEMKMHLALSEQDLPNSKEGVYVQWEESGRTQLFIRDSRVFTCAIHSFIHSRVFTEHGLCVWNSKQFTPKRHSSYTAWNKMDWFWYVALNDLLFWDWAIRENPNTLTANTNYTVCVCLVFCFVCLASKKYKMWVKLTYWRRT